MLLQDATEQELPRLLRSAAEDTSRHDTMVILGMIGGIAISMSLVPQIWKVYKTKSAIDISYVYQGIYIFGLSLVNVYAIVEGLWPVYIPSLLELFLIVLLLLMKIRYDSEKIEKLVRLSTSNHRAASFNLRSFNKQATRIE
jgi:MtN3 and saliva related transmembrane protein